MDSINHLYRGLSLHIEPTFGKKLSDEVQELNMNWDKVLTLAEQQHARLKGSLDSSEEIYNKIGRIINWLGPIKEDLSNKDYAVESLNDLLVKNKKFKVISILESPAQFENQIKPQVYVRRITRTVYEKAPFCKAELA